MSTTSAHGGQKPREKKIAFLGPLASYSHQATKSTFRPEDWELVPTVTIKDVFDIVQSDGASYGVVPFENSTHGIVTFTLENLADRASSYPDLQVCGEVYLDVHHFLLGRATPQDISAGTNSVDEASAETQPAPKGAPLVDLSHIKQIYSHPQAFGQTRAFLGKYLRGVGTVDVTSTSKAAELAAADATGTSAAIAGEVAAEMHRLDLLARCIEDREDNTTRFFVLHKGPVMGTAAPAFPAQLQRVPARPAGESRSPYKSLLSFTVPHRAPGALADVLDCFKRFGLNLTSINSLPSQVAPFEYLFFVEFEGSRFDDPTDAVKKTLEAVSEVAWNWRFFGSWANQR